MSKINIGSINAKNVIIGDNNTITYNGGEKKLNLSEKEREIVEALLDLMKTEDERDNFLGDIDSLKSENNAEDKKTVGARLLKIASNVISVANVTEVSISLYDQFSKIFGLTGLG